jgi:hypothetical protein
MRAALHEGKRLESTNEALEQYPEHGHGKPERNTERETHENAPGGPQRVDRLFGMVHYLGSREDENVQIRKRRIGLCDHVERLSKARARSCRRRRIARLNFGRKSAQIHKGGDRLSNQGDRELSGLFANPTQGAIHTRISFSKNVTTRSNGSKPKAAATDGRRFELALMS